MRKSRNYILDSLKGLCILFVIITHFSWTDNERLAYLFPFWVGMAVPIFMLISGYVYSMSYSKKNVDTISKAYDTKFVVNKFLRFTVPFVMVIIFEYIIDRNLFKHNPNKPLFTQHLYFILSGGKGCGTYYYPIMLQFLLVFPVIYFIIKKSPKRGLVFCFAMNVIYELLQNAYKMNSECYKFLLFRYIFIMAFGCYLYFNRQPIKNRWYVLSFVVGTCFLICHRYFDYRPVVFTKWQSTSCIAVLYLLPIAAYIIKRFRHVRIYPLEYLGKASFNIFLVQMVYYAYYTKLHLHFPHKLLHLGFNIVFCVAVGLIFHIIESRITKHVCGYTDNLIDKLKSKNEIPTEQDILPQ